MLTLEAVSHRPFNEAVFDACNAVTACGGWVKDHRLYSSIMAMIAFELPVAEIEALIAALADSGIRVAGAPPATPTGATDVNARLTILFASEGRDIRRDVPAVG